MTSSVSSPSSSTSFDAKTSNIYISRNPSAGCLVGVLRRFLCSGTLPSHQSDPITYETSSLQSDTNYNYPHHFKPRQNDTDSTATPITASHGPNLMARLMGLDSMPDFSSVHPQKSPKPILRSRSMNSADYDQLQVEGQGKHRRVKTSVSFREMPTFLYQENDEYLVLSFEDVGRNGIERKSKMGSDQGKQRSIEKCRNKENRVERGSRNNNNRKKKNQETEEYKLNRRYYGNGGVIVDSTTSSPPAVTAARLEPMNSNDISETEPPRRRRKKKKKMSSGGGTIQRLEAECSSEDSSPVSVLDSNHLFPIDPQFPTEEGSRSADSSSRRKLAPKLEKYEQPSTSNDQETKAKQGTVLEPRKQQESESYRDMWGLVCRLADRDMVMQSVWSYKRGCSFEDFGDVYEDLQVQILDQLFHELVLES